jgi:DNA-binding LytR/AlgR family response regulator
MSAAAASPVRRVLAVDDEPPTTVSFVRMLQSGGFDVESALDGETGLRLAREGPFDAILLDLRMPVLDGLERKGPTSTVVNAHTHNVGVPASDQLHPATTTYTSSSDSAHNHMVTLTASQLSTLASGGAVTVTSTLSTVTENHTHDFTFQGKK